MKRSAPNTNVEDIVQDVLSQTAELQAAPLSYQQKLVEEISSRLRRENDSLSEAGETAAAEKIHAVLYFTPVAVSLVYSLDKPPELEAFSQEAVKAHFQFLQRAVSSVVRRFTGYIKAYGDSAGLEEELWGQIMEDVLRQLTDRNARLWDLESGTARDFPPEALRRSADKPVIRLALSENAQWLALYHDGHHVSIWDTSQNQDVIRIDLTLEIEDDNAPIAMYFSSGHHHLALEYANRILFAQCPTRHVETQARVRRFSMDEIDASMNAFGSIASPQRAPLSRTDIVCRNYSGEAQPISDYLREVFDWTCSADGRFLVSASERKRRMPPWMMDIGFERAVFVIAKRRVIDWIRKNNTDTYICWHCGTASASALESQCRHCGRDFSQCLLELPTPPCDPPRRENQWTCSHCGLSSRIREPMGELRASDIYGERFFQESEWQHWHDLERIQETLRGVVITYRSRAIPCSHLLELKAQGLTNEEIGQELDIPRGSVDYVWNQCRQQILQIFDESQNR